VKKPAMIDLPAALDRIRRANRVLITTHARADGDAIGCVAAMQRVLRAQGKDVRTMLHEPVGERYAFLDTHKQLSVWDTNAMATDLAGADLLMVLDTCAAAQIEPIREAVRAATLQKLAIDHHLTRDDIVQEVYADESAAACAQIVTHLFDSAGWEIDPVTAELLYVGLATDTGWFRFSNADAAAYMTAARLVAAGAKPNELHERLYLNESVPRARLIGATMSSFELLAGGRLAIVRLPRDVLNRCSATQQMTEDLINEPQRVGSVMACVLLVEPPDDGPIRVSFRSKRGIDVAAIAANFGGGGHARAAGAKINGTMDEVARMVGGAMVDAMPRE
jgi:bifunctional oligoribonuclease and PAP phosphatase NrnA